jgi:hypothetical protein
MMKKLPWVFALVLFIYLFPQSNSLAATTASKGSVSVSASIGEYYLDLSGWQSPYASIILTSDGVFLRATVADSNGVFYLSSILINAGFSHFCLEAIDFKQIGSSYTCFTVEPATDSITKKDIFLPPTMALSAYQIPAGKDVFVFGYTMPLAKVFLFVSDGRIVTVQADRTGYYRFKLAQLKAGKYTLYTKAQYKGKNSLTPDKKLSLWVLSWWEQLLNFIKNLLERLWLLLTSIALGPLWLAIPVLILIIILILKLWPEKFTFIYQSTIVIFLTKLFRRHPKHHLHHYWLVGE